ncbi:MAG: pyridoxamine 5'-phosphate oxidase [Cardiobacteriaceae bacterium]|nr:pyridoxamine 5'-phosphate oxidase [Cardiobacteriaceae bacterium]
MQHDIGHIRHDFNQHGELSPESLLPNPIEQFARWFDEALQSSMPEPNAMSLATVMNGQPSQRTVLLKYFDEQGFVFYTNYHSRKANEMAHNPQVSLLFPWYGLQRQVKIEGEVEKVSAAQSALYFMSRPRESQLGAWASPQSQVIDSKALLLNELARIKAKFAKGEIPLPDFWGGYRVKPNRIEFWQGQPSRLHDRFRYQKNPQGAWYIERLAP